jgi:DNA polymerase I-like protein with 3'-5' exonuclease and polymerase domains
MKRSILVLDCETTGTSPRRDRLHGVGIRWADGNLTYESRLDSPELMADLRANLESGECDILGHNLTFDLKFLRCAGFEVRGRLWDTRKVAHLLDENSSTGLKELTKRYLGNDRLEGKSELDRLIESTGSGHVGNLCAKDLLDPHRPYTDVIAKYCLEDVQNTWALWQVLTRKLKEKHEAMKRVFKGHKTLLDYYLEVAAPWEAAQVELEMPGLRVDLARVEARRAELLAKEQQLYTDLGAMEPKAQERVQFFFASRALEKKLSELKSEKKIAEYRAKGPEAFLQPFDWKKNAQVGRLFFNELKFPTRGLDKTQRDGYSLKEENIQQLRQAITTTDRHRPIIDKYTEIKETAKLLNTFIGAPGKKGLLSHVREVEGKHYVYPEYNDYLLTDRLSCSNPNAQQFPRGSGIKRFFIPHREDSVFLHFDASQIELRIAAHLSQDPGLCEAYELGLDLHRKTASNIFGKPPQQLTDEQRQVGKTTNFLTIFDGKERRLQSQLLQDAGMRFNEEECKGFIEAFFRTYPVYRQYLQNQLATMERRMLVVSEAGRVRRLPDLVYGQMLDRRNRRFKGPKDYRRALEAELERGHFKENIRKILAQAPTHEDKLYQLASLKYGHAKKQGYNFPIQNLGAVMTKRAIIRLQEAGHMVRSTVHDSIDVEIPRSRLAEAPAIKKLIESSYPLSVPVVWDMKILNSFDEKDVYRPDDQENAA